VNGGTSLAGSSISPGGFVSIFGTDLAATGPLGEGALHIPLPTNLSGVSVTINGEAVPIYFVSAFQVKVQAPWDLDTTKPAAVIVTSNGVSSEAANVSTASLSPAVFALHGHAIAINLDGTLAAPAGSMSGLTTHPTKRGGIVQVYATGLGPVRPPVSSGGIPPSGVLVNTVNTPTVLVGNVPASVLFSGLTPQFVGVNQVNVRIPAVAPTGTSVPLQIRIGSSTSPATVTIAVDQ
jgi:uncharacterized protein (TIGR03437 family)